MRNRRSFLQSVSSLSALALMGFPEITVARPSDMETVQNVIDFLISQAKGAPFEKTVDTVKSGDPAQKIKGIVTTFMANREVIQKTIDAGANLIITHEPTYYSHQDATAWLENNTIYSEKRKLLEDNNVVVWRFHDYMHAMQPDPVLQAVAEKLSWQKFQDAENPHVFHLPSTNLDALANDVKGKLQSKNIRTVGRRNFGLQKSRDIARRTRWREPDQNYGRAKPGCPHHRRNQRVDGERICEGCRIGGKRKSIDCCRTCTHRRTRYAVAGTVAGTATSISENSNKTYCRRSHFWLLLASLSR